MATSMLISAASWGFFPSNSLNPPRWMMYSLMADDSVIPNGPSIRQGRLGNSKPRFILSSLCHFQPSVQTTFQNSTPVKARRSLAIWPSPLNPQQPSFTLGGLIWTAAIGGKNGPCIASGRLQQAATQGRELKEALILIQNRQLWTSLGQMASKQYRLSAKTKSTRVRYPKAKLLCPTNCLRYSNFGLAFSRGAAFLASQSLSLISSLMSFIRSSNTPITSRTVA